VTDQADKDFLDEHNDDDDRPLQAVGEPATHL
jgi:hypothetical protein